MQGLPGMGCGGSSSGSMSTLSRDDNMVLSSEDSSCPDESELELALGLSLGRACTAKLREDLPYARILTAKDFQAVFSSSSASSPKSSSSSSSSSLSRPNGVAGTKRTADSVAAPNASSQVVGWPPIRAYRVNSMVNQAKSTATEEYSSMVEEGKSKSIVGEKANSHTGENRRSTEKKPPRSSLFVKVTMDGCPIGRKVDLSAHVCYETLAQQLEDMFHRSSDSVNTFWWSRKEHDTMLRPTGWSKLLDGSSEFVLTYEDKDGDWMLVGDVPWGMFINSVRRLRIMKTSEANGLEPRIQERNGRTRHKPI